MKRTKLKRFVSSQEIKKEGRAQLKRGTKFWGPKSKYRKPVGGKCEDWKSAGQNDPPFGRAQRRQGRRGAQSFGRRAKRLVVSLNRKQKKIKNENQRGSKQQPSIEIEGKNLGFRKNPSRASKLG